jgi:DNA-binding MarR family transcriptional regulator
MDQRTNNQTNLTRDIDYQLWIMLDHLRYMIFKARKRELGKYDITPEQAQILLALGRTDSLTINQLVEYTQHLHHSISTLLNRMEKKGLISKTKIPGKGRKLNIEISGKGQELLNTMTRDSFSRIFTCLSDNEKRSMIDYLCRLTVNSYQALGKEHTPLYVGELEDILNGINPDLPQ